MFCSVMCDVHNAWQLVASVDTVLFLYRLASAIFLNCGKDNLMNSVFHFVKIVFLMLSLSCRH